MPSTPLLAPKLLILGGPKSGKTTYRTQLYLRIQHEKGALQLSKSVENLGALDGDVERLVAGLQPMHTNADEYNISHFTVRSNDGRDFLLEFADYGGEQLRAIGNSNEISQDWIDRATNSSSWLFFVRIDDLRATKSFMSDPLDGKLALDGKAKDPEKAQSSKMTGTSSKTNNIETFAEFPAELSAIECLQRLLFVRGGCLRYPLNAPRIGVLLSCWDELSAEEKQLSPSRVLASRAPLLSAFLEANWKSSEISVWGLSSTGRRLPEENPDKDFARKGPTNEGYIVAGEDQPDPDLTIPITWLTKVL